MPLAIVAICAQVPLQHALGTTAIVTAALELFHVVTVQEGDHLSAGAGIIRAELVVAGSIGDTILNCPLDRLRIVRIGLDINKSVDAAFGFAACHTAQEGCHLSAAALHIGAEGGVRSALGDTFFYCPQHGLSIVAVHICPDNSLCCHRGKQENRYLLSCEPL